MTFHSDNIVLNRLVDEWIKSVSGSNPPVELKKLYLWYSNELAPNIVSLICEEREVLLSIPVKDLDPEIFKMIRKKKKVEVKLQMDDFPTFGISDHSIGFRVKDNLLEVKDEAEARPKATEFTLTMDCMFDGRDVDGKQP